MKRKTKFLIVVCSMLSMLALATACGGRIGVKEWIDQQVCEHEFDDGEVKKVATCTEAGEFVKTCTLCGKEEKEEVEKLPHTEESVQEVKATCKEPGSKAGKKCSVCDVVIEGMEEIPAGHNVVKNVSVPATCTELGLCCVVVCKK